jgi:hypothetical protein
VNLDHQRESIIVCFAFFVDINVGMCFAEFNAISLHCSYLNFVSSA